MFPRLFQNKMTAELLVKAKPDKGRGNYLTQCPRKHVTVDESLLRLESKSPPGLGDGLTFFHDTASA